MRPFPVKEKWGDAQGVAVAFSDRVLVVWSDGTLTATNPDLLEWESAIADWPMGSEFNAQARHKDDGGRR